MFSSICMQFCTLVCGRRGQVIKNNFIQVRRWGGGCPRPHSRPTCFLCPLKTVCGLLFLSVFAVLLGGVFGVFSPECFSAVAPVNEMKTPQRTMMRDKLLNRFVFNAGPCGAPERRNDPSQGGLPVLRSGRRIDAGPPCSQWLW